MSRWGFSGFCSRGSTYFTGILFLLHFTSLMSSTQQRPFLACGWFAYVASYTYYSGIMCGLLNVPQLFTNEGCETGSPVYSPYLRRLKSLTICWCNYKGSTFYSVILRPWVLFRLESNTQPPATNYSTNSTNYQLLNQLSDRSY